MESSRCKRKANIRSKDARCVYCRKTPDATDACTVELMIFSPFAKAISHRRHVVPSSTMHTRGKIMVTYTRATAPSTARPASRKWQAKMYRHLENIRKCSHKCQNVSTFRKHICKCSPPATSRQRRGGTNPCRGDYSL